MSEPTVQVPVSVIGDALDAIRSGHDPALWPDVVQALDALLSQPTPTAEPPSIADMALGTTFRAQATYDGEWLLMLWTGTRLVDAIHLASYATQNTYGMPGIDPSTIRDVTPPES